MSGKSYNVSKVKAFVGDNEMVLEKMIDIFLTNTPEMLSKIDEGLAQKNYDQVNFFAHKLKSSIDNFSIIQLTEDIRIIEKCAKEKKDIEKLPPLVEKLKSVLTSVMLDIKTDFNK